MESGKIPLVCDSVGVFVLMVYKEIIGEESEIESQLLCCENKSVQPRPLWVSSSGYSARE